MPLVMHVESVVHGMILELGHVARDINDCHCRQG
jgi:hypothetical protein